jgi:hypothetical protein
MVSCKEMLSSIGKQFGLAADLCEEHRLRKTAEDGANGIGWDMLGRINAETDDALFKSRSGPCRSLKKG